MPRFDRTGPMRQGPITGRGFGPCVTGLDWRKRFSTKKEQRKALADYQRALEKELEDVKKELEEENAQT